ncbi:MAG: hypothetical protein K0S08_718 [Gammaproteobacteria bacterium]|jgi:hypothetical protein|nr:hypothetical protein [Gammaproteobacteria bacterium]
MGTEVNFDLLLSHLSHDLKNDFISIRAAAGSIKKNIGEQEVIEKKVVMINQLLDQAIARLDAARVSVKANES